MIRKPQYTSAAVRTIFCLDSMENFDYNGRLYIGADKIGYAVSGINDIVKMLENVLRWRSYNVNDKDKAKCVHNIISDRELTFAKQNRY